MKMIAVLMMGIALPALAADPTLSSVDARVLAEFNALAEKQVAEEKDNFRRYVDGFIVEPKGIHFSGKKHVFQGYKVEAVPNVWTFDVRRTDSIVSPYVGVIRFPVILIFSTIWAKGFKEDCSAQTLKHCLDSGGELFETDILYRHTEVRIPHKVEREYAYQENIWVPKVSFNLLMEGLVALLESRRPLPPPQPRSIFGPPLPVIPLPPTPMEGDTSS